MADFGTKILGGYRYVGAYSANTTAGTNSKGSWAQLVASLPQQVDLLEIIPHGGNSLENILFDIGIGPATETVLVSDIFNGTYSSAGEKGFLLPVNIPAGTRVTARSASTNGGTAKMFRMVCYCSDLAGMRGYSRFVTLGVNLSNSRGTAVASGAPGAWAELSTSTPFGFSGGVWAVASENPSAAEAAYSLELGIGSAGDEKVISTTTFTKRSWGNMHVHIPVPVSIPVGSRLVVRQVSASGANATALFTGY